MTIELLSKAATASTSSTSSSAPPIEEYYVTPDGNNNTTTNKTSYNDNHDDEETTTDDDSNYEYDDNSSLSTAGTEESDRHHDTNLLVEGHQQTPQQTPHLSNTNKLNSSSSLSANNNSTSLDILLAEEEILHEYNDGDLQTLNELVNKLHEADLRRVTLEQQQQQQQRLRNNEGRTDDYYDDDDDDDDDDYYSCSDHHQNHQLHTPRKNNNKATAADDDLPSEMPLHPPSFSPLLLSPNTTSSNNNNNNNRQLSISSVDSSLHGPSIEIVPTSQISTILPLWNQSWLEERKEWATLCQLREEERYCRQREREANYNHHFNNNTRYRGYTMLRRSNTDLLTGNNNNYNHTTGSQRNDDDANNMTIRRNRSAPTTTNNNNNNNSSFSPRSSTSTYHNRYGKPNPITTSPNPIVTKSSKKIHRRHARYALTAGMMLGVRESVGGANGVECELEAKMWEESERTTTTTTTIITKKGGGDGDDDGCSRKLLWKKKKNNQQQQSSLRREGEEVLDHPWKVVSNSVENDDCCNNNDNDNIKDDDEQVQQQLLQQQLRDEEDDNYLTQQCERISKYKFSPQTFYLGSNTSEPLPHKYKFKVYAPVVFQRIRNLFGVEKQTFLHSICGKFNLYEFASNAKSGQFFFYSHDGRYMIKTLTYTEQKFLRLILPAYYRHLTRYPHTFLTHFYGLYRVCMPNADNTRLHFVIMRSVFHTEKKIDRVWDLKGSTVGRKAVEGESVAKDVDILEEGKKLRFKNGREKVAFLRQLEIDAAFLATLGIMDYSLLLGLHNNCNDACCCGDGGGGSGSSSAVDETTPTKNQQNRLNTGDSTTGGGTTELPMTNTPHRRNVLMRATINNNGSPQTNPPPPLLHHPRSEGFPRSSSASNPITSMPDLGIQGGTPLRPETYYCGIIDILQYYNARKMGETVIKKAAGGDADNISCVDPETYGKRFVKFISDLVE